MFHTLTNVQQGAVPLQQYIDNRCGQLRVGLRSLAYSVGWWNVGAVESFSWRLVGGSTTTIQADPGFYGFSMLQVLIESADPSTSLVVNPVNGIANLIVATGNEILLTDGLLDLLGFDGISGLHVVRSWKLYWRSYNKLCRRGSSECAPRSDEQHVQRRRWSLQESACISRLMRLQIRWH